MVVLRINGVKGFSLRLVWLRINGEEGCLYGQLLVVWRVYEMLNWSLSIRGSKLSRKAYVGYMGVSLDKFEGEWLSEIKKELR